ncbi:aromatic amino acid lyase [bacterium]|nr:aromatic amino acid lyase [candidate division CSSED10-310 bacterium]
MNTRDTVFLDGENLTVEAVVAVAEGGARVDFPELVWKQLSEFREGLERQLVEHPEVKIYGTNVGCGDLKDVGIGVGRFEDYQTRFIKAHNCGTGEALPEAVVRAIMVIRLNSFAKGLSAIRPETCRLLMDMVNRGVTPWVLEEGSVGASGDLVPLAMIGAVLLGLPEAKAWYDGDLIPAPDALHAAGLAPIRLGAKEAMGLTNGSSFIAAIGLYCLLDGEELLTTASITAALSLEAIRGEKDAYSELITDSRPHVGQVIIGHHMRSLIDGSMRTTRAAQEIAFPGQYPHTVCERVQDRYSFRAVPQVHGAAWEALTKLRETLTIEINSATDNPLFYRRDDGMYVARSGANFHGQPLATVIDYVKLAMASVALITNKRVFSILDRAQSYGLPQDLAADPSGGDTGLMITQYAASARAAESRILATPASVSSVSTAANQEDYVSMGSIGAIHLWKSLYNLAIIIGVELLIAVRALQMTRTLLPPDLNVLGRGTGPVFNYVDRELPPVTEDQYMRLDMEKAVDIVRSGRLLEIASE